MAQVTPSAQISIQNIGDFREQLQNASTHLNKYFYMDPPKISVQMMKQSKFDMFRPDVDNRDDNQIALENANKIARVEDRNLDADREAGMTDWTIADPPDKRTINDGDDLEFDLNIERAPIENHDLTAKQFSGLLKQLPNTSHLNADQFAQFADEIMKRSAFVFETLINTFYNKIDEHRSCIKVFSKVLTYPKTKVYLKFAPRNIFDSLPNLQPKEKFESEEKYNQERRRVLTQMAEDIADNISCKVTFGSPSFGPIYGLTFESASEFQSLSGEYVPPAIASVRAQLEENLEIVLVSVQEVPAFWMASDSQDIISAHCSFVERSKLLIARHDKVAAEAVRNQNPNVDLASYLPPIKDTLDSTQINIVSPHILTIDPDSVIQGDRMNKGISIDKMYSAEKGFNDGGLLWDTGLINASEVNKNDETFELISTIKEQGAFMKLGEGQIISNMSTEPQYRFHRPSRTTLVLPKITFSFRSMQDTFIFGQCNIVPHFEAVKTNSHHKMFMGGLCYTRTKDAATGGDAEAAPVKMIFPGRIFSHLLIKIDKCKGVFKLGFQIKNENFRLDFMKGEVERPADRKYKGLEGEIIQQRSIRSGDQLCFHYFMRGRKQLKPYLLVKLIRNDAAMDIAWLEVPEEQCNFVIWLGDQNDSISIIKARLNAINPRDMLLPDNQ
ncbi:Hypothetical_protein [Hexamita inflata]|uniref:Hypothetical_protein n=1 Tax=Hexamita inflata TaxID=28002 RepID=A0AA86Q9Y2_9EUKA|nr:Hypothetical protein HINF_LOCUS26179 [Hexamita inflata]CAI9949039.1 Hypothetical protein HINF_LOCUS36684 [Hexamita inflata]